MPTRSRVRAKPAPEGEFNPTKTIDATANPPIADEEDDGTIGTEPENFDPETGEILDEQTAAIDPVNRPDHRDVDPSAGNALGKTAAGLSQGQQAAQAELKDYQRRMGNLLEERDTIDEDIKELKKEMKGKGYDMPAVSLIVKLERLTDTQKAKRKTQNQINATYAHAAGIDEDLL